MVGAGGEDALLDLGEVPCSLCCTDLEEGIKTILAATVMGSQSSALLGWKGVC